MSASAPYTLGLSDPPRPLLAHPALLLEWRRFKTHFGLLHKWWLHRHRPYQPLFVLTTRGSGENLLLDHLNQQPEIAILDEVLSSRHPTGPRNDAIPAAAALSHIRYCLQGERKPIRGCTLMLERLADCRLTLGELHSAFPTANYIVLYRQSLADQYVSLQPAGKIVIREFDLRKYCDAVRRLYCDLLRHSRLHEQAVLLSYEELTTNPKDCLQSHIGSLLGISMSCQSRLPKNRTEPLADRIANYRDVTALIHSPLCHQHHNWPSARAPDSRAA